MRIFSQNDFIDDFPSLAFLAARLKISYPMMFQVRNPTTGSFTHVGVMEFTAEEGKAYMPYWIMQNLFVDNGQLVEITNVTLPKGTFVQLRPHETAFTQLSNPRVVLEKSMRSYSCLTKDGQIVIDYGVGDLRRQFTLDIVDTKPADAISVIETDLNVSLLSFSPFLVFVLTSFFVLSLSLWP